MLLFLFGSKDGLVRALLARARAEEMAVLERVRRAGRRRTAARRPRSGPGSPRLSTAALLTLWMEGYARALVEPDGPWAGFAARTVARLARRFSPTLGAGGRRRRPAPCCWRCCAAALLDLLATGDVARTSAAVSGTCACRDARGVRTAAVRRGRTGNERPVGRPSVAWDGRLTVGDGGPDRLPPTEGVP